MQESKVPRISFPVAYHFTQNPRSSIATILYPSHVAMFRAEFREETKNLSLSPLIQQTHERTCYRSS